MTEIGVCVLLLALSALSCFRFPSKKVSFRELGGFHGGGGALAIPSDRKQRKINVETFTGGSVVFELHGDRTLRVQFALMALIVNCGEYKGVNKKYQLRSQCRRKQKNDGERKKDTTKENKTKGKKFGRLLFRAQCVDNEVLTVFANPRI